MHFDRPKPLQPLRDWAPWLASEQKNYYYAVSGQVSTDSVLDRRRFHSVYVQWEAFTFVGQGIRGAVGFSPVEGGVDLSLQLPSEFSGEERRDLCEVSFYIDRLQGLQTCVNGGSATLFRVGEWVVLLLGGLLIGVGFRAEEGEGQFTGHLLPGNRPSRGAEPGAEARDLALTLRTIRRSADMRLSACLRFQEVRDEKDPLDFWHRLSSTELL